MLERYFKKGNIFKWTRPPTTQVPLDGQVVDKVARTTPMSFVGTARDMGFGGMMDPTATAVQSGKVINYRWLDYMPGRTAKVRIGNRNILTGPMSGCPIVRWQAPGRKMMRRPMRRRCPTRRHGVTWPCDALPVSLSAPVVCCGTSIA